MAEAWGNGRRKPFNDRLHPQLARAAAEKAGLTVRARRSTGTRGAYEMEYVLERPHPDRDGGDRIGAVQFSDDGVYKSAQILSRHFRVPKRSRQDNIPHVTPRKSLDRLIAYLEQELPS